MQSLEQRESDLKKAMSINRLHVKLSNQYTESQNKILQSESNRLKQIFKRINQYNLDEHEKTFLANEEKKKQQRKEKIASFLKEVKEYKPKYESKIFKSLETIRLEEKRKEHDRMISGEEKMKKHKEFELKVKERFLPRIDEEKKNELEKIISQLEQKKSNIKEELDQYAIGLEYLKEAKAKRRKNSPES